MRWAASAMGWRSAVCDWHAIAAFRKAMASVERLPAYQPLVALYKAVMRSPSAAERERRLRAAVSFIKHDLPNW